MIFMFSPSLCCSFCQKQSDCMQKRVWLCFAWTVLPFACFLFFSKKETALSGVTTKIILLAEFRICTILLQALSRWKSKSWHEALEQQIHRTVHQILAEMAISRKEELKEIHTFETYIIAPTMWVFFWVLTLLTIQAFFCWRSIELRLWSLNS